MYQKLIKVFLTRLHRSRLPLQTMTPIPKSGQFDLMPQLFKHASPVCSAVDLLSRIEGPCLVFMHRYIFESKHGLRSPFDIQFESGVPQALKNRLVNTFKTVADSKIWLGVNDFGQILCLSWGMSYHAETGLQIISKLLRQIWAINGPLKFLFQIYECVTTVKSGIFIL